MNRRRELDIDAIVAPVKEELERLESRMGEYLASNLPFIDGVVEYLLGGGGKRLRPMLVLLVAALGPRPPGEEAYRLGAALEFIHSATLLHDDVVDQSDIRRGKRVANHVWGLEPTILCGDYLFTRAFQLLAETRVQGALEAVSRATTSMARGEVLQLLRSYSPATTREEYMEVIEGKTAGLISAATHGASYLAGMDEEQREALRLYGTNLGLSFQIADDILDYEGEGEELGKEPGKDFLEGKVTLPFIILLEKLSGDDRQEAVSLLLADEPTREGFARICDLMEAHGVLDLCRQVAEEYSNRAESCLAIAPEGAPRESLQGLTRYVISRVC